jgi:hypothetical protein
VLRDEQAGVFVVGDGGVRTSIGAGGPAIADAVRSGDRAALPFYNSAYAPVTDSECFKCCVLCLRRLLVSLDYAHHVDFTRGDCVLGHRR